MGCKRALAGFSLALLWPLTARTLLSPVSVSTAGRPSQARTDTRPYWLRFATRWGLVPKLDPGPVSFRAASGGTDRLLHESGDEDSLFTLGGTNTGRARIAAAIEVNDVLPRAASPVAPERLLDRPRAGGDYQAVDVVRGHPRQLKVAARVIW